MKRLLGALVAAALLVPATSVVVAAATPLEYGVHLVSTDYWYSDTTFTAVGEVRNDTDLPVRHATVRATALAGDGAVVATGVKGIWLDILDPGEIGSFRIDLDLPGPFATYRIAMEDWSYTSLPANHYFTGTASAGASDTLTTHVTGSITNANVTAAADDIVVATLYAADGKVVGSGVGLITGSLAPGQSAQYAVDVAHAPDATPASVSVTGESTSDPDTGVTLAVAPSDLAYGRKVTLSGTAKPGADVTFQRYDQPTASWVDAGGPIPAGADGSYEASATPTYGSSYRAVSGGIPSAPTPIFVRTAVTLRASAKTAAVGRKVTLSGVANPSDASTQVIIQRKVGSTWKKVATGSIARSGGAFSVAWTPKAKGTYVLRAWVSGGSALYPGTSSTVTIIVK